MSRFKGFVRFSNDERTSLHYILEKRGHRLLTESLQLFLIAIFNPTIFAKISLFDKDSRWMNTRLIEYRLNINLNTNFENFGSSIKIIYQLQ